MEGRGFERHGPGGGWEAFEVLGTFLGATLPLGLLALAAWGAYRPVGNLQVGGPVDPAECILRERLARGEIPSGEFEETLEVLCRNSPREREVSLVASTEGPRHER